MTGTRLCTVPIASFLCVQRSLCFRFDDNEAAAARRKKMKPNDRCFCNSGRKFKVRLDFNWTISKLGNMTFHEWLQVCCGAYKGKQDEDDSDD